MMYLQSALWCRIALLPALSLVAADIIYQGGVCDLTTYDHDYGSDGFYVESQAAFDTALGNCTTIIGPLFISLNYTGPLVMNTVTNITGDISTISRAFDNYTTGQTVATNPTLLTSLQADNLIWLEQLDLEGVPALNSISMAILDTISLLVVYSNPTMSLSFPRLTNGSGISIYGGYSSLNLDQLTTAVGGLKIGTTNSTTDHDWESEADLGGRNLEGTPAESSPIDIKLPSLVNTTYIELWGNISSLYMPSLTTATSSAFLDTYIGHDDRGGISIDNHARQPLDVILPNLQEVTSIKISGGLGSVSFSKLTSFTGDYYVFATYATPLVMNFDPLHEAGSIYVFGKIKSVNISSIQSIYLLTVSGDDPLDCGGLRKDYATIKQLPQNSASTFPSPGFSCSFTPRKSRRLSFAAKIGIGFGVSALGIVLLGWLLGEQEKRRKKEPSRPPDYHLASLDPAPKYSHPSSAKESTEYSEQSGPAPPAREQPLGGL